jgi:hypothetical protein
MEIQAPRACRGQPTSGVGALLWRWQCRCGNRGWRGGMVWCCVCCVCVLCVCIVCVVRWCGAVYCVVLCCIVCPFVPCVVLHYTLLCYEGTYCTHAFAHTSLISVQMILKDFIFKCNHQYRFSYKFEFIFL